MRVLFMTPWYPTSDRPVYGTYVREHAKAASQFVNVAVLHLDGHSRPDKGLFDFDEEIDASVHQGLLTFRTRWKLTPGRLPGLPLRLVAALAAYRQIIREFKPDIIHANVYTSGLVAAFIGRIYRVPVVVTEHTSRFSGRGKPSLPTRVEAYVAYRLCRLVLPVSEYLADSLKRWKLPGPFRVVPNVVDTNLFVLNSAELRDDRSLVFVGALRKRQGKGLPDLLQSLRILHDKGLELHLHVLGDGIARKELENLCGELDLKESVTFHGAVPKEVVAQFLGTSALHVMPSHGETFCLPVAEALAAGTPTVATTAGAIPETLGAGGGLLVPPAQPGAFATAIADALGEPGRWDRELMAASAKRFDKVEVGRAFASVYEELAGMRVKEGTPREGKLMDGG